MEKIRLMLVDDNKGFREVLTDYFKKLRDIEVVAESEDGAEAVSLIDSIKPDVVILDMIMPKLDGIGVLERVHNSRSMYKPKFIMISAFSQEIITQKVMSLGASYFMIKPFDLVTLTERIRTVASEGKLYYINDRHSEVEETATGTMGYTGSYFDGKPSSFEKKETAESENNGNENKNLEIDITHIMHEIGVPAHIKGYQYLRDCIILAVNDRQVINAMTKIMYPCVAKNHQTTPSRVERAIRHAIEVAWNRGRVEVFNEIFGYSISTGRGKPTNGEFIAMIADRISLNMKFMNHN